MSETQGRNLTRQIHQRLQELIREAGKGAERRIEEVLNRRPGWLRDRRRTGAIELGLLLDALDYLGEDPQRFFRLVLGEDEESEGARPVGEAPPIVRLVRARLRESVQGEPCGRKELEALDRLRYYHPSQVVESAEMKVVRTPRASLPHLLGVAASAYRFALELNKAEHTIAVALDIARENRDQQMIGALLQRLSYIAADRGDYAEGLRLAERAASIHILRCDLPRVGQSLVDQGIRLFYLGRPRDAIRVQEAALGYLPESEEWSRYAALQFLAFAHHNQTKLKKALAYAARAEELIPHLQLGSWPTGMVHWVRASIYTDLGRITEAEEHLVEMIKIYRSLHLGVTATATIDLVRIKLLLGKPWEAYETARSMLSLLEPLKHNRIASAAITDLLRGGFANLTMELVEQVKIKLQDASKRPDWRLLIGTATLRQP